MVACSAEVFSMNTTLVLIAHARPKLIGDRVLVQEGLQGACRLIAEPLPKCRQNICLRVERVQQRSNIALRNRERPLIFAYPRAKGSFDAIANVLPIHDEIAVGGDGRAQTTGAKFIPLLAECDAVHWVCCPFRKLDGRR